MTYTNIFGGYNINTAFPSYISYTISGNLQLNWSSSFVDTAQGTNNVTAQINDLADSPPILIPTNNPISTTQGSGVVIVTIPSNPNLITGNIVIISGATTTNGITNNELNITAAITVISSTSFSYLSGGIAGAGPFTGGGNSVTYAIIPTVTLADATLISVGQTIQFNNVGTNDIIINNFLGEFITSIPSTDLSNQYILYLRNNTTQGGTWGITHLGAGTSEANAIDLSGLGTIALNSKINANFPGKTISANYVVQLSDRASILVWTGGTGTITLPNNLNGFYIAVNNEGSGILTINTPDGATIDGQATIGINPSGSTYLIGVDENWNTLGNGIETFFRVQTITIPLTNTNINLTNQQSGNLVQQYTGNITSNIIVFYPAVPGQWYVWNNTTGAFTVSAQLAGPTGNIIIIPQGEKVILYSDGNSIYNTPTIATNATFPDGNIGAPGINFVQQNTTGFYRISSGLTGYASAGTQGLTFGGSIPGYGMGISGGLESRYYNVANSQYIGFKAGVLAGDTIWTLPLRDAINTNQIIYSDAAGNLGFTTSTYPLTTVVNELLYSSAINVISGLATANDGVLVTSGGGVPSIENTLPIAVQDNITHLGTISSIISPIGVPFGGTGLSTLTTAYGVLCSGTTPTNPLQNVGAGLANQALISNGIAALPTWKNINALKVDEIASNSTTVYTNPAVQQYHPSAAKFWCQFNGNLSGTNPPLAGYNVASVQKNSLSQYTINFIVPFTTINYVIVGITSTLNGTSFPYVTANALSTNNCIINIYGNNSVSASMTYIVGYGTQ